MRLSFVLRLQRDLEVSEQLITLYMLCCLCWSIMVIIIEVEVIKVLC